MEMTEPKINMTMQETADEQSTLLATLPSKTAIRRNMKKQMALFRQDAHSIRDKETRNQIFRIIRSSMAVMDHDYDQQELSEIAQRDIEFVRWAVNVELAGDKDSAPVQPRHRVKKPKSEIADRKKKERARWRAQKRSLLSEIRRSFKKKMAQYTEQATQIPDEKLRSVLLNLMKSFIREVNEYRNCGDLLEFVESSTDTIKMGIGTGLYGHRWRSSEPRTQ
jgi:hypothetical protein